MRSTLIVLVSFFLVSFSMHGSLSLGQDGQEPAEPDPYQPLVDHEAFAINVYLCGFLDNFTQGPKFELTLAQPFERYGRRLCRIHGQTPDSGGNGWRLHSTLKLDLSFIAKHMSTIQKSTDTKMAETTAQFETALLKAMDVIDEKILRDEAVNLMRTQVKEEVSAHYESQIKALTERLERLEERLPD